MTGQEPQSRITRDVSAQETLPISVRTRQRTGGPNPGDDGRRNRWRRVVVIVTALAILLTGGTAVGAMLGGPLPFPFFGAWAAKPTATPTLVLTPTITPTLTPSATRGPTATPTFTPVGPLDLGCGPGGTHPVSYVIGSGATNTHAVALTFDDGPSADWTANILSTLEKTHTPATFFVVGSNVSARPNLIAREHADGFPIFIHTWDHPYMTKLTTAQRVWEISATADAIHNVLGANYCIPYWRPPFGDYNAEVVAQAREMGLSTMTWSVDPQDWSAPGVQVIVDRVLSAAQPGSIILLHDGYFNRQQTAQALPLIISGLKKRGLTPVTIPRLMAG
ncbi:MAG: polysaccharide deacetylase family protein [Ktedonobacterales bacterium]